MTEEGYRPTPRQLAEDLIDEATGDRGAYHGVPMTLAERRAKQYGIDPIDIRLALADVRRERGYE